MKSLASLALIALLASQAQAGLNPKDASFARLQKSASGKVIVSVCATADSSNCAIIGDSQGYSVSNFRFHPAAERSLGHMMVVSDIGIAVGAVFGGTVLAISFGAEGAISGAAAAATGGSFVLITGATTAGVEALLQNFNPAYDFAEANLNSQLMNDLAVMQPGQAGFLPLRKGFLRPSDEKLLENEVRGMKN